MNSEASVQSGDFAMIGGKRYPVKFGGYDRATYKHMPGCLALPPSPVNCCQCGAIDRATKIYTVDVAP